MAQLHRLSWTGRLALIDVPSRDNRTLSLPLDALVRTLRMPLPVYAITDRDVISCGFIESVRVLDQPGVDEVTPRRELWGDGILLLDQSTAVLAEWLERPDGIPCGTSITAASQDMITTRNGGLTVRNWILQGLALYMDDTRKPAWEHTYIYTRDPS